MGSGTFVPEGCGENEKRWHTRSCRVKTTPHIDAKKERNKVMNLSVCSLMWERKTRKRWRRNLASGWRSRCSCLSFTVLANGERYMAKAWDDRVGCALLCDIMKRTYPLDLQCTVTELNCTGRGGNAWCPDQCECCKS